MRHTLFLTVAFISIAFLGCSSSKPGDASTSINAESASVYVEGRDRGVTPMTLRVIRSRGEFDVRLMQGKEVVRIYELAHGGVQRSPEQHALNMDLESDNATMGFRTLGLDDLESFNDTLYVVPYSPETIAIDDKKYGLTLLVSN